jgi:hypothetical protein
MARNGGVAVIVPALGPSGRSMTDRSVRWSGGFEYLRGAGRLAPVAKVEDCRESGLGSIDAAEVVASNDDASASRGG